jgi:hypothetical protein
MFQRVCLTTVCLATLCLFVLLAVPAAAQTVVEPKTKTAYPVKLTVTSAGGDYTLAATGVALREKTVLKVDVYTIVSYLEERVPLTGEKGAALVTVKEPKRIQMDLRRGFGKDKLISSFEDVIEKNYDDTSAFAADMDQFFACFDRDAEEGDKLVFDYNPSVGLTVELNGETKRVIENFAFTQALWTVWFGAKPVNDGMKEKLLAELGS